AHFAPGAGLALSVEVNESAGDVQYLRGADHPWPSVPAFADQVHHGRFALHAHVAQGPIHVRAEQLIELGTGASFDGEMATVVGAWCGLVHPDLILRGEE